MAETASNGETGGRQHGARLTLHSYGIANDFQALTTFNPDACSVSRSAGTFAGQPGAGRRTIVCVFGLDARVLGLVSSAGSEFALVWIPLDFPF